MYNNLKIFENLLFDVLDDTRDNIRNIMMDWELSDEECDVIIEKCRKMWERIQFYHKGIALTSEYGTEKLIDY